MTDYRLRNHDLLYAEREPRVLTWRNIVIFGAIAITVLTGVVGHLTDRFNTTATGIATTRPSATVAQPAATRQPTLSLNTPANAGAGS